MTVLNRLFQGLVECCSNGLFCCLVLFVFIRLFFSEYGFLIFSSFIILYLFYNLASFIMLYFRGIDSYVRMIAVKLITPK